MVALGAEFHDPSEATCGYLYFIDLNQPKGGVEQSMFIISRQGKLFPQALFYVSKFSLFSKALINPVPCLMTCWAD